MDTVEYRECVITTLTRRGKGEDDSPIRVVTEVWVRNGDGTCDLIADSDPCAPIYQRTTGKFVDKYASKEQYNRNRLPGVPNITNYRYCVYVTRGEMNRASKQ